jgi:arylsulfatase A-like enzyme
MSDLNVIFLSIDSLRRDFLGAYDQPYDWVSEMDVETDNFDRFANKAVTFDNHYVGSLPCMPTRREWQTGIQEFLWRPWGPIESYDQTLPQKVRSTDTLTELITDHFHLFQHGSKGYYEDYHGFEFIRGHEDDAWKTSPYEADSTLLSQVLYDVDSGEFENEWEDESDEDAPRSGPSNVAGDPFDLQEYRPRWSYVRNVDDFQDEEDFFAPKVFKRTVEWLEDNQEWDSWFLRLDEFDVHEPFHVPEPYASMYTDEDPNDPNMPFWPYYGRIDKGQSELTDRQLDFVRAQFAGNVTMVDRWFGRMLDKLDEENLWDETIVIVTSDHGHFLGEHNWMGKPSCPDYNTLAQTPLLIWHPDSPHLGDRISELTSAVDIHSTITESLGVEPSDANHSKSLIPLLLGEQDHHRDWALYGWWGSSINVTDGEYTYMLPCQEDVPAEVYSTSQMDAWGWMTPPTAKKDAEAGKFLPYTDTPVWRFTAPPDLSMDEPMLFDLSTDPRQEENIAGIDTENEERMQSLLLEALNELKAPDTQYTRYGLEPQ